MMRYDSLNVKKQNGYGNTNSDPALGSSTKFFSIETTKTEILIAVSFSLFSLFRQFFFLALALNRN